MTNLTQLRLAAREIFDEALRAVEAGAAVRRAVRLEGSRLSICDVAIELGNRRVYSIAIGKAAVKMASALEEILDERLAGGVLTSDPRGVARDERADGLRNAEEMQTGMLGPPQRHSVFHGGHPEPNEQSLASAQACFALLDKANAEHALVIFLISGGGSAMIEWPISMDITLADLRTANKALINSGASIAEINAVRRAFSAVKGGRLAARAPNCDQVTLIVSDVPADEERNVASGPSLAPPAYAPGAREVIARYNLASQLPETIVRAVESEPKPSAEDSRALRRHFVLLDNRSALEAAAEAAKQRGFVTEIASDISDQPIAEGCTQLLERLAQLRHQADKARNESADKVVCLISGGEFACPVRGDGIGGRNLETALRLACMTNLSLSDSGHFVALCAGTDGIDGNSPAAGALVDNTTMQRARAIDLDPNDFLERSDAYSFFVALGDVVATGPTGTNVRDLRILLAGL
jgi:hydroxypyruvate reductase